MPSRPAAPAAFGVSRIPGEALSARYTSPSESLQNSHNLIQQIGERPGAVKKVGNRAEQVAEKIARPGLCRNIQDDLVSRDLQPEQVQIDWADVKMQNRAATSHCADSRADGL